MTRRDKVIAAHRLEGEPQTMARVEGMAAERWPHRVATFWIENSEPRRHVCVRFAREPIEGAGQTWFDAFDAVDAECRRRKIRY